MIYFPSSSHLRVRHLTRSRLEQQYNARTRTNSKASLTPGELSHQQHRSHMHVDPDILCTGVARIFLWNPNTLVGNPGRRPQSPASYIPRIHMISSTPSSTFAGLFPDTKWVDVGWFAVKIEYLSSHQLLCAVSFDVFTSCTYTCAICGAISPILGI